MLNKKALLPLITLAATMGILIVTQNDAPNGKSKRNFKILAEEEEGEAEMETENSKRRSQYEWLLTRDPKTGLIPEGIRTKELALMRTLPVKENGIFYSAQVNNTYAAVGPTQNGGRTRAIVYDRRYNGTTNQVIMAGGVTGGIFRSTDGGKTWKFVHPANQLRSVSSIAQDPTRPDTWYAGTGEPIGASVGYPNTFIYGEGMFKSTDNGATWTKLSSTNVADIINFSSQWSFVHKVVVHPTTGDVYAAVHRRVVRSSDGGSTWTEIFGSTVPTTATGGIADILINNAGTNVFVAMSGRNADRNLAGIFSSPSGNAGSFTRIAGGIKDAADSVAGWRAYDNATVAGEYVAGYGRIILALSPSNQNLLYTMVENADFASDSKPEADLFKCNMGTSPFTWTSHGKNLSASRTAEGSTTSTTKYMELQGGYNMALAVHPTNPNMVFAGGVNLFKSTDGFGTAAASSFIGGIGSTTYTDQLGTSHADIHSLAFDPTNPNKMLVASDGGIGAIDNVTASTVSWGFHDANTNKTYNSQYQTLQYYHVGIDPTTGSRNFFGGAQDNSTTFRDRTGIIGQTPDSNDHYVLLGGDGCAVGMSKKNAAGNQHLFCAAQNGQFYRMNLFGLNGSGSPFTKIKPNNTGEGEFITYFHLDPDNTDHLYYATIDSLYRTNDATNVTATNWTYMEGVAPAVNGSIFAMETTRGPYSGNNHLFIGTSQGKIYRLRDPQLGLTSTQPADITPSGMSSNAVVRDIAVNPRNQDTVIAVVSNYNVNSIFWTGNATSSQPTWQIIEGNLTLPSVRACEIIAKTTGIEYYVGTSIGLYSTTAISGSSTVWSRETGAAGTPAEMINNAVINSLAHRWTDNTLVVGTHGNGMFAATLGNAITITTAVTNPIRNNTDFIRQVYPNLTRDRVNYQIGNMYTIKKLGVQVTSMSGAVVYRKETGYQNGNIDLGNLPAGAYIVTITSGDRKYQSTSKVVKQ
ncbi:MAG: hypothetical protein RLZZ557_2197 [Bacteroidota bacterium]